MFLKQLHASRSEIEAFDKQQTDKEQKYAAKLKKHERRLLETTNSIQMIYVDLMVTASEALPIGVLQGERVSAREYSCHACVCDEYACNSLCCIGVLQGMRAARIPLLVCVLCDAFLLQSCTQSVWTKWRS